MKSYLVQFFSSNQVIALISTVSIFLITIVLVAKRWIGFSVAFILLLFSLIVGILINNPQFLTDYNKLDSSLNLEQQNQFKKLILQALDDVKLEVKTEQSNLNQLKDQVQDILHEVDIQKQKLETFIEETRSQFQSENLEKKPAEPTTGPSTSEPNTSTLSNLCMKVCLPLCA